MSISSSITLVFVVASLFYFSFVPSSTTNDERILLLPQQHYNIAFIGNSISFVNDLPRFMEALSIVPSDNNNTISSNYNNNYHKSMSSKSSFVNGNRNRNRNRNKKIKSTITQNSCLHGSLSFQSLLQKGNGMYHKWGTSNALVTTKTIQVSSLSNTNDDDTYRTTTTTTTTIPIYDYGACTIKQLLYGYDNDLSYYNTNNIYINDGMNPCFENYYYYQYLVNSDSVQSTTTIHDTSSSTSSSSASAAANNPHWDYIVLNDQSVYPGIVSKRNRSIRSLKNSYIQLLKNCNGNPKPVLLVTYAYIKTSPYYYNGNTYTDNYYTDDNDDDSIIGTSTTNDDNIGASTTTTQTESSRTSSYYYDKSTYSILGNISTFTSRIYYGYKLYASILRTNLPIYQQPILAPVGLVFLLLYEENYILWKQLFYDDGYHPSPHGTFVIGSVLYTSIYNKLPSSNVYNSKLFYDTTSSSSSSSSDDDDYNNNYDYDNTNTDDMTLDHLWYNARKMHMNDMGDDHPYPTIAEARYLLNFVKRVVLLKEVPSTLLSSKAVKAMEELENNY